MFWGGAQRIVGPTYERLQALISRNVAVYSAHLPLDAHPDIGNNALLARALGLTPSERFGEFEGVPIGIAGQDDVATDDLLQRAHAFAEALGGTARASDIPRDRRTRRWAIITGAGGGSHELIQARERGIDTLIVGEGPHHVTVSAPEFGVVVIFAGHYATETLGVRALGEFVSKRFDLPHEFLFLPTGS
jgi:putative NIF3 family GTP cyclohydrolase 1 type 2